MEAFTNSISLTFLVTSVTSSAVRDGSFALTCALQREPPLHLTALLVLAVVRIQSQRPLAAPEQKKHKQNSAQTLGHSSV